MIEPRKSVQRIKEYEPLLEGRRGKLRLDFNENTIGCSPRVIEALRRIDSEELSAYPEYSKFRKNLAKYLNVNESEVLMTNGTDEAIKVVMDAYLGKGEEIIIPTPTFAMFEVNASVIGAKITKVLYNSDLSFPAERVLSRINKKTKMVVLVNPNNPTGTAIKEKDIIKIVEKARNSIILTDEAYYQYYGKSCKGLIRKYDNVIVTQTFSKVFGLAGLRLGYVISNRSIIANLQKVISPYSVNSLALIGAVAALEDVKFVDDYVTQVRKNKKYVETELKKLDIKIYPSTANFLVADFGDKCNIVCEKLKEKGILVRNRTKYPLLNGCLRIGIGTEEQCRRLINGIKKQLNPLLIFDIDGVLVDVSKSYREAIKLTVQYYTKTRPSDDDIQRFKNKGCSNNDWDLSEGLILEAGKKVQKNKIIDRFQKFYLGGLIEREKWLLSKRILRQLSTEYTLAIFTGRPRKEAEYVLKKNKVREFFTAIVAMEDVKSQKPNPAGLKLLLEETGKDEAFYFGDNVDDMRAAQKAGIKGIGVIPPTVSPDPLSDTLIQNGAQAVLKDVSRIMEVLK